MPERIPPPLGIPLFCVLGFAKDTAVLFCSGFTLSEPEQAWRWRASGSQGWTRKRQMTDSKIESAKELLTNGVPPRDVAENPGVSVPTLYRWVPATAHA